MVNNIKDVNMSNIFATLTIENKDEDSLVKILTDLHLDCNYRLNADTIRGKFVSKYTLDITEDCLEIIKSRVPLLHLTVTKYNLSPLGFKIIKTSETVI